MAMAIAGPATALANPPISESAAMPVRSPRVPKMVPMSSDANRPCAIAPSAPMQ